LYFLPDDVAKLSQYLSFITSNDSEVACAERFNESVLIYVISPSLAPFHKSTHSYNFWAIIIVLFNVNPNFLDASCCKVDVVKGAAGSLLASFSFTSSTIKVILLFDSSTLFHFLSSEILKEFKSIQRVDRNF
jgi:hypothetical protein